MDKSLPNKKASPTPVFDPSSRVFKGKRIEVYSFEMPGKKSKKVRRDVVTHPGAVLILPLLDNDHIVMIRNQRFAVGKDLWELPAGTLEAGEAPIDTAKRELIEETGYKAGEIHPLTHFYSTPGFCNEIMHAFVAEKLTAVGQALEDNEEITVEIVSWQNALEMARDGTIEDAKTLTTLFYYHVFFG